MSADIGSVAVEDRDECMPALACVVRRGVGLRDDLKNAGVLFSETANCDRIPAHFAQARRLLAGGQATVQAMAPWDGMCRSLGGCFSHAQKGATHLVEVSGSATESAVKYARSAEGKKAAGGFFNCIGQCIPDMDEAEVTTFSNGCCICCVSSHHTPMEFTYVPTPRSAAPYDQAGKAACPRSCPGPNRPCPWRPADPLCERTATFDRRAFPLWLGRCLCTVL
jgi:hypothetical protein